ncbi:hypothetical protein [Siminovitchia sp. 179-K 8D1 HS]|uniref:hypothetical protein n=1 Tax=Siminovitchia sp. 179-K 8D1 HS TaxID=3142385 RepID=UPI00399FF6E3
MEFQRPNYDQLWKDVITELFEEFLLFFSPELFELADFTIPPQFLEQELQTILPESESSQRVADKLVQLQLKNGDNQWVYVHIEVQGDYKKIFPKRMFQSFYRIMDLYDEQIYALALFTSDDAKYNADQYNYEFLGTELTYRYHTYRIASQSESTLLKSQNPFALAVLAGLYVIKSKKNVDRKYQYKRKLMRLLLQDKMISKEMKREYIQKLFVFIDHVLRLPEETEWRLVNDLKPIIQKEAVQMGLSMKDTFLAKYYMNEGEKKGKIEGKIEIAVRLMEKGYCVEDAADITGLSIEEIKRIKDRK